MRFYNFSAFILELVKQTLLDMWGHKLRSCLALFGIVWGTVAVVLLLALGQGFYHKQIQDLSSLGEGSLYVILNKTSKSFHGLPAGQMLSIDATTVPELPNKLNELAYASPDMVKSVSLVAGDKQTMASVVGVSAQFNLIKNWQAQTGGRFIDSLDTKQLRRVAFLGASLTNILFAGKDPLHQQIIIAGIPFTVIGIRSNIEQTNAWEDNQVFIPYTTYIGLWGDKDVNGFIAQAKNLEQTSQAKQALTHYFASLKSFDPDDKQALHIIDYSYFKGFFIWFFRLIQGFLALCGFLTLAVGGIGVANTLFLIVQERTHEIGLRKAMGAQNHHILGQILAETFIIVGLGGVVGLILALSLLGFVSLLPILSDLGKPELSWSILLGTLTILAGIALLAGYFPARRAAHLMPVQALAAPPC